MGRVKIEIKYLENKGNRSATFRKRSTGLVKKAKELHVLCGATVELLMIAEDGRQSRFSSADYQSNEVGIGVSNCMLENDDGDDDEAYTNDSVTVDNVNGHQVHLKQQQQQRQQQQQQIVNQDLGYGGQPSSGEVMDYQGMLLQQQVQMLARSGVQYHQEGIYHGMQHLDPNLVDDNSVIDDFDLYLDPAIMDDGYVSNSANCIFDPMEAADSEHSGINEAPSTRVNSSMNFLDNQPKPTTRRRSLMKRRKTSSNDNTTHGLMPACSYPAAPVKYELDDRHYQSFRPAAPVKYELDDGHYQSLRYFTMPDEEDMNKFLA